MKKFVLTCLLTMTLVGIPASYTYAQSTQQTVTSSAATPNIASLCSALSKATEALQKDPATAAEIGSSIEKKLDDLDRNQKLTPADKKLLKETMVKLMKSVAMVQLTTDPQMAAMVAGLTEEQKQEMIDTGMQAITKELDQKIDACQTLGDFSKIAL